MTLTTVTDTDY